jgi:hypothetical protein
MRFMLTGLRCKCGKRLKLPESSIGKTGSCPVCKSPLRLVAPSYADGASPCDARLEITAGPDHVGEVILVAGDGPIGIGRAPAKDLILAGSSVSRNHCRLVRIDGGWRIEDEKSTSGLFVNNERVGGADLHNDDRLRIGDYELSYVSWNPSGVAFIGPWPPPFAVESTDAPAQAEPSDPMPPSEDAGAAQVGVFASRDDGLDDDNLYQLSEGEIVDIPKPQPQQPVTVEVPSGGPTCPSCGRSLAPNAKICVQCGINLKTGRAIITSQDTGLDAIYTSAESLLWWVSWLVWFGIYPIASEAFGVRKPYYIRAIALLTVCTSLWFLAYEWTDSPRMHRAKNYMLWSGNLEPNRNEILAYYTFTNYGDSEAFLAKYQQVLAERADEELKRQAQAREAAARKHGKTSGKQAHAAADADAKAEDDPDRNEDPTADASAENKPHLDQDPVIVAHKSLSPEQQYQGRYSPSQLLTAAFLHGGLMHLVGNLIFLLVIGSRINALVGNLTIPAPGCAGLRNWHGGRTAIHAPPVSRRFRRHHGTCGHVSRADAGTQGTHGGLAACGDGPEALPLRPEPVLRSRLLGCPFLHRL